MAEDRKKFGEKVREARKKQGLGLRELARKIGLDPSNLSRIERGQRPPPDLEMVLRIAEKVSAESSELLRLAGVPEEVIAAKTSRQRRNWIAGKVVGQSESLTHIKAGESFLYVVAEPESKEVLVGLRPEDITLFLTDDSFKESSARNRFKGKVINVENRGNYNLVELDCKDFTLEVSVTDTSIETMDLACGKEVFATFKATAAVLKG